MIKSVEGVKRPHQIQRKTDINNLGDELAQKARFKVQGAAADHNQKRSAWQPWKRLAQSEDWSDKYICNIKGKLMTRETYPEYHEQFWSHTSKIRIIINAIEFT